MSTETKQPERLRPSVGNPNVNPYAMMIPDENGGYVRFSDFEKQAQALAGAEDLIKRIRNAVTEYHLALDRREHGGIAGYKLTDAVQDILDMPWVPGSKN